MYEIFDYSLIINVPNTGVLVAVAVSGVELAASGEVDVADVEDALLTVVSPPFESVLPTITVRVAVPTRPFWSVALYTIVCVPATDVSIDMSAMGVEVAPSTDAVIPRLRSAAGEVVAIIAPRSAYEVPSAMVAGFSPLTMSVGAVEEAFPTPPAEP